MQESKWTEDGIRDFKSELMSMQNRLFVSSEILSKTYQIIEQATAIMLENRRLRKVAVSAEQYFNDLRKSITEEDAGASIAEIDVLDAQVEVAAEQLGEAICEWRTDYPAATEGR
jgi:DNA-binding transcriptional regulator YhcF (GntR family)